MQYDCQLTIAQPCILPTNVGQKKRYVWGYESYKTYNQNNLQQGNNAQCTVDVHSVNSVL